MAFAEGSPLHPAYGAGYATVTGATILKAFFPEKRLIPNPVVTTPTGDNTGPDGGQIAVGRELDKLAANIASGRNIAGVHWRSDCTESAKLGGEVTISLLCDRRETFNEDYLSEFTRSDDNSVKISEGVEPALPEMPMI